LKATEEAPAFPTGKGYKDRPSAELETERAIAFGTSSCVIWENPATSGNLEPNDLLFKAVIAPGRDATTKYIHAVIGLMGGFALVLGVGFWLSGAWPVSCFLGGEIFLLYLALAYHHGNKNAREELALDGRRLMLSRIGPWKKRVCRQMPARRLRVVVETRKDGRDQVVLRHGDRQISFGVSLNDRERRDLAREIRFALARIPIRSKSRR